MLRFFRQLRKEQLMYEKTRKYLIYAIGEILLVVIGILIALQVNNWNERNKDLRQGATLIQSITTDLESDMMMIDSMEVLVDGQIERFDSLQAQLTSPEVSREDVIELVKNDFDPFLGGIPGFKDNSYRSATSSGTISNLDADLREQLYELYLMQTMTMRVLQDYEQLYLNNVNEFVAHYPLKLSFVAFNDGAVYQHKWASPDFDHFTTLFNATGTSKRNFYRIMKLLLVEARTSTMETLSVLNDRG